jgi:hypothetical protein
LRFLLKQFFLDFGTQLSKGTRCAATFILDFEDIKIAAEFDDAADSADG